jgi:hypothetical protein
MAKAVLREMHAVNLTTDPILGELMGLTIDYEVAQGGANSLFSATITITSVDTPAQIRAAITSAILAHAHANGYNDLTATDIIFFDLARGVGA